MRKIKIIGLGLAVCLAATVTSGVITKEFARAVADDSALSYAQTVSHEMFGDVQIQSSEYLYDFNDSPNYVHVDFADGGYAIYYSETMELLEYSPFGELPYADNAVQKYYAGPSNYFYKVGEGYVNATSGADLSLSETDVDYSRKISAKRLRDKEKSTPDFEKNNLNIPAPPGAVGTTYIPNAKYFTPTNPTHGENKYGTCGSVAAQLLLGYNNYYNDRRIIAPKHLNGGWNNAKENDDIFDVDNYLSPQNDPNVCYNPSSLTRQTAGTNDAYYSYIISEIEPKQNGTTTAQVKSGLNSILSQRLSSDAYSIKSDFSLINSISSKPIKNEIAAGRPLIIGMSKKLGGDDHWVVGYGYQDYTYPVGHAHAGETYSGYVVHFGWTNDYMIWVNEAWCDSYLSLQINHEHDLSDTGINVGHEKREYRCVECGYRTVDELYQFNATGDTIVGCNYPFEGKVDIPYMINGIEIHKIGESAFANQTGITEIILPYTIEEIGRNAFSGCESLERIQLPYALTSISDGAFAGCYNLKYSFPSGSSTFSIQDNILYNKGQTEILHTGKISQEITIDDTVTRIAPHAFDGNENLKKVTFKGSPEIGDEAFAHNINLQELNFDSDVPPASVGAEIFSFRINVGIYVPYDVIDAYRTAFGEFDRRYFRRRRDSERDAHLLLRADGNAARLGRRRLSL